MMEHPRAMALEWTHETVLSMMDAKGEGKMVLDAAAGQGALTLELSKRGYHVVPIEIEERNFKSEGSFIKTDLNFELPLRPNTFDYVVSVETLEHLWNPFGFIRSAYRVLKIDGLFIFSTPNIQSLFSRLLFLISGRFAWFRNVDFEQNVHIHPLPVWQVLQTLKVMKLALHLEGLAYNQLHIPYLGMSSRNRFLLRNSTGQIVVVKLRKVADRRR